MKKLVAMALALMLLLASAACAESVYVEDYSNFALNVTSGGETENVDLSGLELSFASGMSGEIPTIQADVIKDGATMLAGTIQFINNGMYVGVTGLENPVVVDLSMAGEMVQSMLAGMLADPEALLNLQLPTIPGISIPKVDLLALAAMLGVEAEDGAQSASFALPAETINAYLSMLTSYRSMIPDEAQEYVGPIFDAIDQMVESGSGFALDGTVSDDGTTGELTVNLYPASDGVTADTAVGGLYVALAENQANLVVQLYEEGEAYTLGELALTSDPDAAVLNLSMDVMGMAGFQFSLYPLDGAQVVAAQFNAEGETLSTSFTYGPKEGGDFASFALEVPNQVGLSIDADSVDDGNGGKAGTFSFLLDTYDESAVNVSLTSDVAQYVADVELRAVENLENAVDFTEFADQLGELLGGAMDLAGAFVEEPAA